MTKYLVVSLIFFFNILLVYAHILEGENTLRGGATLGNVLVFLGGTFCIILGVVFL